MLNPLNHRLRCGAVLGAPWSGVIVRRPGKMADGSGEPAGGAPKQESLVDIVAKARVAWAGGQKPPLPRVLALAVPSAGLGLGYGQGPWSTRLSRLAEELPGWAGPLRAMHEMRVLHRLGESMDAYGGVIRAPNFAKTFKAYEDLPMARVRVVVVAQDPYPTASKVGSALRSINAMPHSHVRDILGEGYEGWDMVQGAPWPDGVSVDEKRPRVRIGAIPYAMGRSLAFPQECEDPPASYRNLRQAVLLSYPSRVPAIDPELRSWSDQGVLMLNACPVLYGAGAGGSSRNPNMWTAWTSIVLSALARANPACVFVLLGNSAKAYKKDIVNANAEACVIETGHPSSRSSSAGTFLGDRIFVRINEYFQIARLPQINW